MSYIIKNDKYWLRFDRFVRGMDIVTTVEPVGSFLAATEFSSKNSAREIIKEADKSGYDTKTYEIFDKEKTIKEHKEKAENEANEFIKDTWNNTSIKKRQQLIQEMYKQKGEKEVKEFLEKVGDSTKYDFEPTDENELLNTIYNNMEKMLGRELTDSEKNELMKGIKK